MKPTIAKIKKVELMHNDTMQMINIDDIDVEYLEVVNFLVNDLCSINDAEDIRILETCLYDKKGVVSVSAIDGCSIKVMSGDRNIKRKINGWIKVNYVNKSGSKEILGTGVGKVLGKDEFELDGKIKIKKKEISKNGY